VKNSKFQSPKKHQTSRPESETVLLLLGVCDLRILWCLDVEIWSFRCASAQRSCHQNSAVTSIACQIFREARIDNDFAGIARRRSMHEVQDAVVSPQSQTDMRGRVKTGAIP